MKLKDCKNWKAVRLNNRTILKDDMKYMSADQRDAIENLEVIEGGRKGYYTVRETNLKRIRTASGMSQSKLSELSGVSGRMIPKYETGEKDINKAQAMTVYKLAQALGCTVEDLLEK